MSKCCICGSTHRVSNHHPDYNYPEITYPICGVHHLILGRHMKLALKYLDTSSLRNWFIKTYNMTPEECQAIRDKYPQLVQKNRPWKVINGKAVNYTKWTTRM